MAGHDLDAVGADLTSNGGADGNIEVADTTGFVAGARAWLSDDNSTHVEVLIVDVVDANNLKVRLVKPVTPAPGQEGLIGLFQPNYGYSDVSAFTTAQHARLDMPAQFVYGE